MEINKTLTDTMMGEIDAAIKTIAAKHGLSGSCTHATYNSTSVDFKVRVEDIQANWNIAIQGTGLKPDDLGREVMMSGRKMRIRGWDYAAKTNHILLTEVSTGKHFCAPVRPVVAAIQAEAGEVPEEKTPEATAAEEAAKKRKFETLGWLVGLPKTVEYGQIVRVGDTELRLIDINRRAPKYPIVAENVKTGKLFKLSVAEVVREG